MAYKWRFVVKGCGAFPIDMLRYDACYPCDQDCTEVITLDRLDERYNAPRSLRLISRVGEPTNARWASFGWYVMNCWKEKA